MVGPLTVAAAEKSERELPQRWADAVEGQP
jgi:hypothetical protein